MPTRFHRFTNPAWLFAVSIPTGGSAAQTTGKTYDYINVASGGVGGLGSAPVDNFLGAVGQKIGGPNQGTYFWAFGEDATASDANRGHGALAENIDYLDDLLHNSFAVPTFRGYSNAGPGNLTSVVIPAADFPFVSDAPATSPQELFVVTDTLGNELFVPPATKVVVASIAGAVIGSGFPAGAVTLNLNVPIVPGRPWSVFRVHYRVHRYLSTATPDPIGRRQVGAADQVVKQLFRLNGTPSVSTWWNSPYVSTVWDLALSGMNERYRRGTVADIPATVPTNSGLPAIQHNQAGGGSWYQRTGPAMSGWSQRDFWNTDSAYRTMYLDPLDAIWTAHLDDFFDISGPGAQKGFGGGSGFVAYGGRSLTNALISLTHSAPLPGMAKFLGVSPRTDTQPSESSNFTAITPNSLVVFDKVTVPGRTLLTMTAPNRFWLTVGPDRISAISVGYDMLEIEHVDSTGLALRRRTYFIEKLFASSAQNCLIVSVDGEQPDVLTGTQGLLTRWLSMEFFVGDGIDEKREADGSLPFGSIPRGMVYAQPPKVTDLLLQQVPTGFMQVYAQGQDPFNDTAFAWGGFNRVLSVGNTGSTYETKSILTGSGGIFSFVGSISMKSATFIDDIISQQGNILALAGNVLAYGPLNNYNGIVAGKQLGQSIQTIVTASNIVPVPTYDGLSIFISTSYVGPSPLLVVALRNVSINALIDSEVRLVIHRQNPLTSLSLVLIGCFSDSAFLVPVPTFFNLLDIFLTPTFGPNGAIDVYVGRQLGNNIFWERTGGYPVPLGSNMDRTYPKFFVNTQRGFLYDPEITTYPNGVGTTNADLRGGVGAKFSFARDIVLNGLSSGPGGVVLFNDIWLPPLNPGHLVDTVAVPQKPAFLIESIGLALSHPIIVPGSAGDTTTTATLSAGLAAAGTLLVPLCTLRIGALEPSILGADVGLYTYPFVTYDGLFGYKLDGVVGVVTVTTLNWTSLLALQVALQVQLGGGASVSLVGNFLKIKSLNPAGSFEILYGDPWTLYWLGFSAGQRSPTTLRDFQVTGPDRSYGAGLSDRNFSVNEGWPSADRLSAWTAISGGSQQALVSFPGTVGVIAVDRITLKTTFETAAPHVLSSGRVTVWVNGTVLPAF